MPDPRDTVRTIQGFPCITGRKQWNDILLHWSKHSPDLWIYPIFGSEIVTGTTSILIPVETVFSERFKELCERLSIVPDAVGYCRYPGSTLGYSDHFVRFKNPTDTIRIRLSLT